jgi:hypothetical protein
VETPLSPASPPSKLSSPPEHPSATARCESTGYNYDLAGKDISAATHWDAGAYQY